jgi:hypothetical protein
MVSVVERKRTRGSERRGEKQDEVEEGSDGTHHAEGCNT